MPKAATGPCRRLALETPEGAAYSDANVAIELELSDGRRDLIVAADVENPLGLKPDPNRCALAHKQWRLLLDGQMCITRRSKGGRAQRISLCQGRFVRVGDLELKLNRRSELIEVRFDGKTVSVVSGMPTDVESISVGGTVIWRCPPSYLDKMNLLTYVDGRGRQRAVTTQDQWQKRRAHILQNMQLVMGPLPDDSRQVPLKLKVLEEASLPKAIRKKVTFAAERHDRVPAYLFLPKGLKQRAPAMLCLHQTTSIGKAEPAGMCNPPSPRPSPTGPWIAESCTTDP